MIMGFISVPDEPTGKKFARELVEKDFAACVKVLTGLTSYYKWEGKLEEDNETYIIVKSIKERVQDIDSYVKSNHSNYVYEFIYAEVDGNKDYVNWVMTNLIKK